MEKTLFTTEAQRTQRGGYFFDLSQELSGQIKILNPAVRDRIGLFVWSRIIGVVGSTRAYCSKDWLHEKIIQYTLCVLCASSEAGGEICCYWKVFNQ
jgi:hypothetical protein